MALLTIPAVRLSGLSGCVPQKVEYTRDYQWITKKEREQLIKSVGVEKRHVAPKDTTTADLCVIAAEKLLTELAWDRKEIELLVFVSQSRDYWVPTTACIIQDRLGLAHSCIAFDISMGCSGFVYGLSVAGAMMQSGAIRKALLLVGDISTLTTSYRDKSTYPLFGDAGTATALEFDEDAVPMIFNMQTDGSGFGAIIIRDGGARNRINRKSFDVKKYAPGIHRTHIQLELDGIEVFNFSLREVVPNIKALLGHSGKTLADFDYVVFHQANLLINETVRKMLRLEKEKVPYSIRDFGNTSCASVPLTMITALRNDLASRRVRLLLSAFGVGLSWGSVSLETDTIVCPELIIK